MRFLLTLAGMLVFLLGAVVMFQVMGSTTEAEAARNFFGGTAIAIVGCIIIVIADPMGDPTRRF